MLILVDFDTESTDFINALLTAKVSSPLPPHILSVRRWRSVVRACVVCCLIAAAAGVAGSHNVSALFDPTYITYM